MQASSPIRYPGQGTSVHVGKTCEWVRAAPAHHAALSSFSFCRSGSSDAEIRVMAAEEGLGEDSLEVPALLQLVRRAPGPEVRPPGEAGSSKSSHLQDLARLYHGSVVEKWGIGILVK